MLAHCLNLDPGWECQSLPSEENKKRRKERKFPIKEGEKAKKERKKERKFPIKDQKKTEETSKKVFGPDNIRTIQNKITKCDKSEEKNN